MAPKNLLKLITKGFFITFEGPEGCGKSTHSRLLVEYLRSEGKKVVYTREPGGTKAGELIRNILLDKRNKGMAVMAEAFLYLAARAQIVSEIILPALKKGKIVVCDRFQDATVVYQGYAGGLDIAMLDKLGRIATAGIKPDLTIILDIDTGLGLRRTGKKDRMEGKSFAFHKKVRKGYLALARKEPKRIKVVGVRDEIAETQKAIRAIIDRMIL